MAAIRQYPFPTEILPSEVSDAYHALVYDLGNWLSAPTPFETFNLVDYFEEHLAYCESPTHRLRYLCRLTTRGGINHEPYPQAAIQLLYLQTQLPASETQHGAFTGAAYFSWLAVRLTEAVCELTGSARLRGARADLHAEWAAVGHLSTVYQTSDPDTTRLFKYLFGVLIPFAQNTLLPRTPTLAEKLKDVPRPTVGPRSAAPPPEPLPQTLQMLCQNSLTPADVRDLLVSLGAIDPTTGRWHLGELTGKAAKPKSAFPAAYRALVAHNLLRDVDGPVWLAIFVAEYGVTLSSRMANYDVKGQVSKAFHEYHNETKRWIKLRQAKHEANQ